MKEGSTRRLVLDTSVIVEYIILRSMYRPKVVKLFDLALSGEVELYVNPVTLSELLYVASRIYSVAEIDNPNDEALAFIEWVKRRSKLADINEDIIIRAGELRKLLRVALPDCYVIATAEALKATPVFKIIEREMKPVLTELRKLGVKTLNEIEV